MFGRKGRKCQEGAENGHNEELHCFCSSPNITRFVKARRVEWGWHVVRIGGEKWVHNFDIEMDLTGRVWKGDDRIHLALDKD